jgi:hypothetical protein
MQFQIINSRDTQLALEMADEEHWDFRVLGTEGMLDDPLYRDEWWFIPLDSEMIIPQRALKRVEAIQNLGIRTQGLIVAHEAPLLLNEPQKPKLVIQHDELEQMIVQFANFVMEVARIFGLIVLFSLSSIVMLDPALIVVLEDGTWVEVMRWVE